MAGQIPMTRNGVERLKEELHQLKSQDRPNIIQAIAEARAQGDLSENAEYESAKERQGFIEGRIAEIEAKLSNVQIIDPATLNADGKCVFGATIELEDLDEEKKFTYQIVGDDEADIKSNKISISSPLARALIGKENGDVVEVETPGGQKTYEITNVSYI
jgi:transcription elongation factor GreA